MKTVLTHPRLIGLLSLIGIVVLAAVVASPLGPSFGQEGDEQQQEAPNPIDEVRPAPASIGADVPLSYFGPSPSQVQKELVGPVQLLRSGQLDQEAGTITIPLYRGQLKNNKNVWYVLTDTTDKANADALGLNHAPKLAYAAVPGASRNATLEANGTLTFEKGEVDFSPQLSVTPGPAGAEFPPSAFQPGSVGDADYSPLIVITNSGGQVYNAPVIAGDVSSDQLQFCDETEGSSDPNYSIVHDKVVSICPIDENLATVKLQLTTGFSFSKPVFYLSFDANNELPASLEASTFAPALANIDVGNDDAAFSAIERLFGFVNGPVNVQEGVVNPQRQGFQSALRGEGGPLNVFGGIPTVATDYSPLWDMNVGEWTQEAIANGYRSRLIEEFQVLGFVERGFVTGPGGAEYGSTGFIVNCPIVFRFL